MKLFKIVLIALACIVGDVCMAQVPAKPAKPSPIVDMAGIINNDSLTTALNAQLDSLSKKTGNQIVIVTVNDFGGKNPRTFAIELGKKWGIGSRTFNNGIVIVVKPKNDKGNGLIGMATGYGLESVLPDALCKRIQNNAMLPHFKEGDYAAGIKAAVDTIVPIVMSEFPETNYIKDGVSAKPETKTGTGNGWFYIAVTAGVITLISFVRKRRKKNQPQQSQPESDTQAASLKNDVAETAGAAGVASATTAVTEPKPDDETEEEDDNDEPQKKDEEPKPYEYDYGGGKFGGGGATTTW